MQTTRRLRIAVAVLLIMGIGAGKVFARTWHVEQDGSGDWVRINTAVEAAASGDTIRIGPGRYSDMYEISPGGIPRLVVAHWSEAKDLVLIGDDRDSVVIGPASYSESRYPTCFYNGLHESRIEFRDLTLVNAYSGIYSGGHIEVYDCAIDGCKNCLLVDASDGNIVERCSVGPGPSGYDITSQVFMVGAAGCQIADCVFVETCLIAQVCSDLVVENTQFDMGTRLGGRQLALNWDRSTGVIDNCSVSGQFNFHDGTVSVDNCRISTSYTDYGVLISRGTVTMSGCTLLGHAAPTGYDHSGCVSIWDEGNVSVFASGNHFLVGDGSYAVSARYGDAYTPIGTYDFRNNWWGTADRDSITAVIFDMNDVMPGDPPNKAVVEFEPFANGPVPNEEKSLGDLKALYLGR